MTMATGGIANVLYAGKSCSYIVVPALESDSN